MNHWIRFNHFGFNQNEIRALDPAITPLATKMKEEWHCLKFCEWLCSQIGVSSETAFDYMSRVNAWHTRTCGIGLAAGMDMKRIKQLIKGLARSEVAKEKPKRIGVRPQLLAEALDICLGKRGEAGPEAQNYRAAAVVAFAALLRGCEACLQDGKTWSPLTNVTRADVRNRVSGAKTVGIRPAKKCDAASLKLGVKHHVPLAAGVLLDPCAELDALAKVDPVPSIEKENTPLFRIPSSGAAIRVSQLRKLVKMLMKTMGRDPAQFGAHSLRIGGATALFAQGASDLDIKSLGRWSSDCFEIYVRTCEHDAMGVMAKALSRPCLDVDDAFDDYCTELDAA